MLLRKLWRTIGRYKAQFISMIIMIALGIGFFVGFNMEWFSLDKNTSSFFESTGFADFRVMSDEGFTSNDLEKIKDINGVDNASRFLSVNAEVKEKKGDSLALTVTENKDVSGMVVTDGADYDEKSKDGVWLSDQYATNNNVKIGDKLTVVYKNIEISGTVKGLIKSSEYLICVRDETQLMPDYNTYGYAYISPQMYENAVGMAYYPQINVLSQLDKKEFTKKTDIAMSKTMLVLTKDENVSYSGASGEKEEGKTMGSVLPVLFLLIAVLTMVSTMHRLTAKEKTQIGTLKALGFKDKRILRHYTSYAFIIGIIGIAFGIGLGYLVAWYIMNPNGSMGTYMDMPEWKLYLPWFCYAVLLSILAVLTFIGFLSVKQMLRGTAADALVSYSPKKMKSMAIEKTKWFHKLSFGTRWNLRDTTRHKSRTAMCLVGIVGCMTILVCAFGMRDTMNSFIDVYYDGATNYTSRIYLAEEATKEQREELIEKYKGDWSASLGVQLDEKTVSLDIYDTEQDKVRFPGEKENYTSIGDNGAYICMRIADEHNLQVGDTITISPYGSDEKYDLKVSGIICSLSESIVISPNYAEKLDIPYSVDSIYTDTVKDDINTDNSIKSVQSKQMIMESFDSFIELMNTMILLLIFGAVLLGVVVLYNLGVMSYAERYREMATLKVVGFKDKRIGWLLIDQNLWTTVVGVILGLPVGIAVLNYLITALATDYEMKLVLGPVTFIGSILLTFGVSMIVSLMVARKNKKIDMVEALKGVE